jgi:hypothetical protein
MNQALRHGTYTRTYGADAAGVWRRFFLDTVEVASARRRTSDLPATSSASNGCLPNILADPPYGPDLKTPV